MPPLHVPLKVLKHNIIMVTPIAHILCQSNEKVANLDSYGNSNSINKSKQLTLGEQVKNLYSNAKQYDESESKWKKKS